MVFDVGWNVDMFPPPCFILYEPENDLSKTDKLSEIVEKSGHRMVDLYLYPSNDSWWAKALEFQSTLIFVKWFCLDLTIKNG